MGDSSEFRPVQNDCNSRKDRKGLGCPLCILQPFP